jgi:hypothetical protein
MFRFFKALALACLLATGAAAHGYLAQPAARNVQHNSDWCPACLNAGGAEFARARGHGLCGDPVTDAPPRKHEFGGPFATPRRVAARLRRGETFLARVVFTAWHGGRWSLRLCPGAGAGLSQACLDAGHLSTTANAKFVESPGGSPVTSARFRVPRGFPRGPAVLQWTYETANSCLPAGYAGAGTTGLQTCAAPSAPAGEGFWNCADVDVT